MRQTLNVSEFSPELKIRTFNIFESYPFTCLKIPSIFQFRYRLFSAKGDKWVWGSLLRLLKILLHLLTKGLQRQYRARPALAGTRAGWLHSDRAVLGHTTPPLRQGWWARVNVSVTFLAAGPVSLCGNVHEGAHGLFKGSTAVCEMGIPETLSEALCSALGVQLLWGRAYDFRTAQQGWSQLAMLLNGDFPPKLQSQELLSPAQLVAGLYSFTHFPTSIGHAAPLLVLGTRARKHTEVKVLGCSLTGHQGWLQGAGTGGVWELWAWTRSCRAQLKRGITQNHYLRDDFFSNRLWHRFCWCLLQLVFASFSSVLLENFQKAFCFLNDSQMFIASYLFKK